MIEKVKEFIERQRLLNKNNLYIVALSGGADSVALLRVLLHLGYRVEAAHCNFNLRELESQRDEQFVVDLCHRLDIPLHRSHFDTKTYAETHHVSIEMAARQLRYRYFEQLCNDIHAEAVCVAHHRDDNAETLLINLLRGTGIHGLTGISARRDNIVRPLLCVSREEILQFLKSKHQDFVIDSSNLTDDVVRNKIRLNVIPLLKEINPNASDSIIRAIQQLTEAEKIYNAYTKQMLNKLLSIGELPTKGGLYEKIDIPQLQQTVSPLCILFEWLAPYGFNSASIKQICSHLDAHTGRLWQSATHELAIDRQSMVLSPIIPPLPPLNIPETGLYLYAETMHLRVSISEHIEVVRNESIACLDADRVHFPLTIRPWREGDRFIPFGMTGSKLVSDYLTDLKLPLLEKRHQLLVSDAQDNVVWIVGRRPAAPYCISRQTTRMLKICLDK